MYYLIHEPLVSHLWLQMVKFQVHLPFPSHSSPHSNTLFILQSAELSVFSHLLMEGCSAHDHSPRLGQTSPRQPLSSQTSIQSPNREEGCVYLELIKMFFLKAVSLHIFLFCSLAMLLRHSYKVFLFQMCYKQF